MNQTDLIIETIKKQIEGIETKLKVENIGQITSLRDGIIQIYGLPETMASEILEIESNQGKKYYALALNLEEDFIGAVVLGDSSKLKVGDIVRNTGRILSIPVGKELIGRVVNPLGQIIDDKNSVNFNNLKYYPIERKSAGVIERSPVNTPLHTGIRAVDSMIPIGRGQRELIIGDRQTGKTALAIDAILNQRQESESSQPICVYVGIGQKRSNLAKIVSRLEKEGAMKYTIAVIASASDPASFWYLAPYAGVAIAEYFMDRGKDVLIIYDDLTKHAWAYREISLLLRRPPGREAYPGDVFYLHSRLLERACKVTEDKGGGSITALPIIETQLGDISAYIPTNVISITDGQIFLETDAFNAGQRPAVNVGLSVSRVGSAAQTKAMKKVSSKLKLELAQFQELAAFVQFASDLDSKTKSKITHGQHLMELLKQEQYAPLPFEKQVCLIYAGVNGYLDGLELNKVSEFCQNLLTKIENHSPEILENIRDQKDLTKETEEKLKKVVEELQSTE
ncbi:MAG TPA: F0F1 ATP synthase subunit alpha [Candidatus Portnoybacteria bacterium]|nr:F0F1 ATP synthase subunit alpha [Candidatus Portnoybacteria bacterium]